MTDVFFLPGTGASPGFWKPVGERLPGAWTTHYFGWPGLGNMGYQAVIDRDYPLVLAFVMIGGAMVILGNLIADILYAVVDPRIKY